MYIPRTLEKTIREAADFFPVVLVTGPSGAGKTTLLKACGNDTRSYVSLDVLENRRFAREDPALFLDSVTRRICYNRPTTKKVIATVRIP